MVKLCELSYFLDAIRIFFVCFKYNGTYSSLEAINFELDEFKIDFFPK